MKTEREHIAAAIKAARLAERQMAIMLGHIDSVVKINADDPVLMNAASHGLADMMTATGQFRQAHARVTDILMQHFPNYADELSRGPIR